MRYLKTPVGQIFFSVIVFTLATGASSGPRDKARDPAIPARTDLTASFSYNLDGTKISGGEVDQLQINNAVYITKSAGNPDKLVFFLGDKYDENSSLFRHSLRFTIPDKTGPVSFVADDQQWQVEMFLATADGKYDFYGNEAFTVSVNTISSGRVTGTFSGKLKLASGTGKQEYAVTEGRFDLPVRTLGK